MLVADAMTTPSSMVDLRAHRHAPGALRPTSSLSEQLRRSIRGEVRFDTASRALYARDASNFRMTPVGVVVPRDADDVSATLSICREHNVPILARGGGTSLAGQCCNAAVVLDFSKYMNRVLDIDPQRRLARALPGTVLDELRRAASVFRLTFGPDPATHDHCTIGGMVGNNSCGAHAVMAEFYGPGPRMEDNVRELDVLTYDGLHLRVGPTSDADLDAIIRSGGRKGQIYADLRALRDRYAGLIRARYPQIPRRVSGYNLTSLLPEHGFNLARALVGSESTCVTVLEATLELVPAMPYRAMLVLGYASVVDAGHAVADVRALEPKPIACEGLDDVLIDDVTKKGQHQDVLPLLPRGRGWLIVQFGSAEPGGATEQAERARHRLQLGTLDHRVYREDERREGIWQLRESGLGATAFVPGQPDTWPG